MILSLSVLSVETSPFSFRVHLSGLLSMGSHRVGHDWSYLAAAAAAYKAQRPWAFPDVGFLVLKPGQPLANQDPGHPSSVYHIPQSWMLPLVCPTPCLLSITPHPPFLLAHHFCSPQGVIYSSYLGALGLPRRHWIESENVSRSVVFWLFCNPMDCSPPGSSVHGNPRQEYWRVLPFPSPDTGIKPMSLGSPKLAAGSFPLAPMVTQMVKISPAVQETWVLSPGQEDLLEEGMGTSILAWDFHGQRSLAGYSPWGRKRVRTRLSD